MFFYFYVIYLFIFGFDIKLEAFKEKDFFEIKILLNKILFNDFLNRLLTE